jgi:hypothetical protein
MIVEKAYIHSGLYKPFKKLFDTNLNMFLLFLIIITVLTENTIKQDKMDPTFVLTHGYHKAKSALDELGIAILKGRYGTGKSTMAIHLASHYVDNGYEPYKFEGADITHLKHLFRTKKKRVVILENIIGDLLQKTFDLVYWKQVMKVPFLFKSNTKIIITTYCVNRELRELLTQNINKSEETIVNLDENESLTYEDKTSILNRHSQKHNTEDIEDYIDECCKCNTVIGFPLMCSLFCSDTNNVAMGVRYFAQFPSTFVERIEKLIDYGIDNDLEGMNYSVLVYIAIKQRENNFVSVAKNDMQLKTMFRNIYNREYTLNVKSIHNSVNGFRGQYLDVNDVDEFSFIHHGIKQAFLITFGKIDPVYIIESVPLDDLLTITRPAKYKGFPSESWFNISPKDSSEVYLVFSKRIVMEYICSNCSTKEIGSYLKQYAVDCSDWVLLGTVFQVLKDKTNEMDKQYYIPSLINFFQEITNGGKLCLPLRLEPIGFRLTWEMICAAKNDEKEMFAKLVQNATEVKNLPDNFIISIIDEENNSLLHYLVVWGYDDGILLLETESTWKTTLKNKQNFTPVHLAAYLGRHKFLELFLKKIENIEPSTLQKLKNLIAGESEGDQQKTINLMELLQDGEIKAKQDTPFNISNFRVNEYLVSSLKCGTESQYEDSRRVIEKLFPIKCPSNKAGEIRK